LDELYCGLGECVEAWFFFIFILLFYATL
jgi:hypothetical protein